MAINTRVIMPAETLESYLEVRAEMHILVSFFHWNIIFRAQMLGEESAPSLLPVALDAPFNSFKKRHDSPCFYNTRLDVVPRETTSMG